MLGFRIEAVTSSKYFYDYGQSFEERFTIVAARDSDLP